MYYAYRDNKKIIVSDNQYLPHQILAMSDFYNNIADYVAEFNKNGNYEIVVELKEQIDENSEIHLMQKIENRLESIEQKLNKLISQFNLPQ